MVFNYTITIGVKIIQYLLLRRLEILTWTRMYIYLS
jgi:hypothetical protein